MSFTSRDLARATDIYNQMLEDPDCSIFLVIAGSTCAGGCMDLYAELVRNNMIDGIVATGASHRRHGFLRRPWPQALSGAGSAR